MGFLILKHCLSSVGLVCFFLTLRTEPKVSHMLSKHSTTTDLNPQASLSLSSFFLFCLPEVGFLWIASPDCPSRQGWCQTQRSACLCLPSPGTKGMCHWLYFYVFNVEAGAREMAPWLRELPALLVDPRSVLRVHVRWLAGAYNLSSRRCKTFLLDYKNMCPHP